MSDEKAPEIVTKTRWYLKFVLFIYHWVERNFGSVAAKIIICIAFVVLISAAWYFNVFGYAPKEGVLPYFKSQLELRSNPTPNASKEKFSIYVAPFVGDNDAKDARAAVIDAIQEEFNGNLIQVSSENSPVDLPLDSSFDERNTDKMTKQAREILARDKGNLLIWGRISTIGNKTIKLYVMDSSGKIAAILSRHFTFTENNMVEAGFAPRMRGFFAAYIVSSATPAFLSVNPDFRDYMVDLVKRIKPIRDHMDNFNPDEKGIILQAYAALQSMLGTYYSEDKRLEDSAAAFEEILNYWTKDKEPINWAETEVNLGATLQLIGDRTGQKDKLEKAVSVFNAALTEFTHEKAPLFWAQTQTDLGAALISLGEYSSSNEKLVEGIADERDAGNEFLAEGATFNWAEVQMNLAVALDKLGNRERNLGELKQSEYAHTDALSIITRDTNPFLWAKTQQSLCQTQINIANFNGRGDIPELEDAMTACRKALEIFKKDQTPLDWALTQHSLGSAFASLGVFEKDRDKLKSAIDSFSSARDVFARQNAPRYQEIAQKSIQSALYVLDQLNKEANH